MTLQPQVNLQQWLDEAASCLATGMLDRCADAIRQALAQSPHSPEARLLEARLELARNQPDRTLSALDAYDLNHPHERGGPEVALLRAEALMRANHQDLARELLEKLTTQYADDVRPHRMMVGLYIARNLPTQAVVHLREVLRLSPSDQTSRRMLAQLLADSSPQDSVALLEYVLSQDNEACTRVPADEAISPSVAELSAVTHLTMARLCHKAGRDRDAEEIYRQLLVLQPEDANLWLEAGRLADQMGAADLAIFRIKQAAKLRGYDGPMLAANAHAHMRAGHMTQAGQLWWRLYRKRGGEVEAAGGLLVCALALGRGKIVRLAHRQLAIHASRHERRKTVMRLWAQAAGGMIVARQLNEPMRVTNVMQGTLLGPILQRSADKLQGYAKANPQRADAHYHLSMCLAATDRSLEAGRAVMRALRLNPRYIAAAKLYARLESYKQSAA